MSTALAEKLVRAGDAGTARQLLVASHTMNTADADKFITDIQAKMSAPAATATAVAEPPGATLSFFESIALPLVERLGVPVAPCYPWNAIRVVDGKEKKMGKTVMLPSPLTQMSQDSAQIHEWGLAEPNSNVCVYAQQVEGGLCFVDKDGAISLRAKYEAETGKPFPKTLLVRSSTISDGNGGTITKGHWYFRQTPRTMALDKNISEDKTNGLFSFRVKNEYVASIGSIHPDTGLPYAVAEDYSVLPMPDEFLDWLLKQAVATPKTREEVAQRGKYMKGTRYTALISELGRLWNGGYDREGLVAAGLAWARVHFDTGAEEFNGALVTNEIEHYCDSYGDGQNHNLAMGQQPTPGTPSEQEQSIPIVEDESDNDSRFEMTNDTFDTSVYEKLAERATPYPVPSDNDLVSVLSKMLVHGTSIPLAYVREPLKAMVLHTLDGKLAHHAFPEMSLRGNYFSLGESEGGKTTGLQFALDAADVILKMSQTHPENLFRYKSETTFIRSFTPEGTLKRDAHGNVKSGRPGHASQFLYIKEGNLVANSSDYFTSVFSQLTNLYDQTEAGTESMTNGDFTARSVKTSTVMCFTPTDHKNTFGGKGNIGAGGLNRWGLVNPVAIHDYDDKDWERLSDEVLGQAKTALNVRVHSLLVGEDGKPATSCRLVMEEPEATKIRLEVKVMLKKLGAVGKRLMDYFMREQVVMAATSTDGRLLMTGEQAKYAQSWVEAQIQCRLSCWPSDAANQIEQMEHAIRKAVNTHSVSEVRLKDACHFYRQGSGGWFVFKTALSNAIDSGAIKWTGSTRKKVKTYCPGSCSLHPEIKDEKKDKKK